MKQAIGIRKTLIFGASLLLPLVINSSFAWSASAQFTSPPGRGTPKGTAGGGSRPIHASCQQQPDSQEALLAVAPTEFVGLTFHTRPTVWVYLPKTTATTLEFSLFTEEQQGVYQTNLPIATSGLLQITLPKEAAPLTTGKPYYWTVALVCDEKRRTKDWVVSGWIQQQPLGADLQRQFAGATPEQRIRLYAQTGFWYEALNAYLGLRQAQPENANLTVLWDDLLKTAGLHLNTPSAPIIQATH